ncbi:choline dehydrogenase [Daldinia vernicosa]|uniref:choline dehydrogenase n=1 Tax=Daldinia vernicosa TaxID=114800 RepID=UPI002007A91D|nr:choline dehydrogenase [Daldinia vernicosa]KAI0848457.1 choline dehydrogenase [Daldinia vernicosa]
MCAMDAIYDYVIVGGGTAGLTLAARLSENPKIAVAVVEAGTYYQINHPIFSTVPMCTGGFTGSSPTDMNPGVDWGFITTSQKGAGNRELHYTRGKCLGGSSGRNAMMYLRPDKGSLDQWAELVGDSTYAFENMLPYFRKSCKFTPADPRPGNDAFSSESGPLHVSYGNNVRPFSQCLGRAFSQIGIPTIGDFNSGSLLGSQFCTFTIDPTTATRSSAQTSFLDLCQARPNLKVFRETLAKRVCINGNKQATGVQISSGLVLTARREVILSAGAFQSPQLLMVSGIGPADTLKRLGIPVIVDRPGVGQNLTDHIMYGPCHRVKVQTISTVVANPAQIVPLLFDYVKNARGPLANPGIEYVAFEKIPRHLISEEASAKLSQLPHSWPDMEYISMDSYSGDLSSPLFNLPNDGHNYASILVSPCAPLSRGSVTITSDDTADLPVVDPNWLSDPIDAQLAVAGYKRARELFSSSAMRDILLDSDPEKEFFPGLDTVKADEEILHTIRNTMTTIYHASGTCRMGRAGDPTAVVDPHARVFGVERLRVVDSSAFALLPPGHPQSMVYALAEKIAEEIQNEG